MIVGIDPGKEGAFVLMNGSGYIESYRLMPLKADERVDYLEVKCIIHSFQMKSKINRVFLERAMPMAMGAKHAFNYGRDFAAIEIALLDMQMPVEYVEPSKWVKNICEGIDKNLRPKARSEIAIQRIMPSEVKKIPVSPKAKRMHEGVMEAALIAEYGRRVMMMHS